MPRRVRIVGAVAAVVLIAAAGAYAWWWHRVAGEIERGLPAWAASLRGEGVAIGYERAWVAGFPFAFRLTFVRATVERRGVVPALAWQGDGLTATARPWRLREWALAVAAPSRIALAAGDQRWSGTAARADGRLVFAATGAEAIVVGHEITGDGADPLHVGQLSLRLAPDPGRPYATGIAVTADRVRLPDAIRAPLGRDIAAVSGEGALVETIPRLPVVAALEAWRRAGGAIDVERFAVRWGPLDAKGAATLALDRELQPIAAGTLTARGHQAVVDALLADGAIGTGEALVARVALAAASVPAADGAGTELRLQFAVQDGRLAAGAIGGAPRRLLVLPRIRWPE